GAETEDGEAERERALAAEAVAERAGGEQQAREDEHVGVDDPLQLRRRSAEVVLEGGERDVEDGVVEADRQQRCREDEERPPAPRVGRESAVRHGGPPGGEGGRGRRKRDGSVSFSPPPP